MADGWDIVDTEVDAPQVSHIVTFDERVYSSLLVASFFSGVTSDDFIDSALRAEFRRNKISRCSDGMFHYVRRKDGELPSDYLYFPYSDF